MPTVGKSGLNGGVLFMRLDRLKAIDFENKIIILAELYHGRLVFAEQDLLNAFFHDHIGKV